MSCYTGKKHVKVGNVSNGDSMFEPGCMHTSHDCHGNIELIPIATLKLIILALLVANSLPALHAYMNSYVTVTCAS